MAEDWVIVKVVGSEEEANVVMGFLENCGIDSEVESLYASEFPADVGGLSEVRVRVPADRAQEATALLNERENVATGQDGAMAGAPLDEPSGTGDLGGTGGIGGTGGTGGMGGGGTL